MRNLIALPMGLTKNTTLALIALTSVISWVAAREAIITMAPIIVWALGGCSLVFALAFIVSRIDNLVANRAKNSRDKTLAANEAKQSNIATDRLRIRSRFEARLMAAGVRQVEQGLIHPAALGDGGVKFSSFSTTAIKQIEGGAVPVAGTNPILNYETIARGALASRGAGRFIVFGSMGSGKTTLAKHTLDYAVDEIGKNGGGVFIIDPHAPQTVWGEQIKVVGAGLDYDSIARFMDWLIVEVKERYELGCGDDSQPLPRPPIFIICEEWSGVIAELQSKKQWSDTHNRTLYMDARKAGIGYFLVSHEHTVKALGIQGMGNLLNGVEFFVTLEKNSLSSDYAATVGKSFKDKEPHQLTIPGPYNGRMAYSNLQCQSELKKADKYLTFKSEAEPEAEPFTIDLSRIASKPKPKPKHHPDNVNMAIDALLSNDPDTFPSRGDVAKAVGVIGGKYYAEVGKIYSQRFNDWR